MVARKLGRRQVSKEHLATVVRWLGRGRVSKERLATVACILMQKRSRAMILVGALNGGQAACWQLAQIWLYSSVLNCHVYQLSAMVAVP